MLRSPLYSFSQYDPDRLEVLSGTLTFRNALFLASPVFYRILEKKNFEFSRLNEKERYGLLRYYNRMSFRATPFGAFASVSLLSWQTADTETVLAPEHDSLLHLLPGQELLTLLLETAAPAAGEEPLMLNPTLYRAAGHYRYVKGERKEGTKLLFALTGMAAEPLTETIVTLLSQQGAQPVNVLLDVIIEHTGATRQEANDYLQFLLDEQCLFSCRQGTIMENSPATRANSIPVKWETLQELPNWPARQSLTLAGQPSLADLAGQLAGMTAVHGLPERGLFYGGLERPVIRGGAPAQDQPLLMEAIETLQRLSLPATSPALTAFIAAFRERFDRQQVPLLEALDPDLGITYGELQPVMPGNWLKDIPYLAPASEGPGIPWTAVHQLFLKKWKMNPHRPDAGLALSPEEISSLPLPSPALAMPPSLAIMYSRHGDRLVIDHAGGASATSLTGRFSVFSTAIQELCRDLADQEGIENPGVLFADIGQLTDSHIDNINRRTSIYPYYLPVNTWNNQPSETTVALHDLHLRLHGGELILVDVRRKKRVIPRLTTAFNALHNGLAIFRLLYDLQYQGLRHQLSFDLESFFPDMTYYPRVTAGKVILCTAKWVFLQQVITGLCRRPFSLGRLHLFRAEHQLPARLILGLGDQQLSFDLADDRQALFFLDCTSRLPRMVLQEWLLPPDKVSIGNQPYHGQYVASLVKTGITYAPLPPLEYTSRHMPREFATGSSWLYLKLFCTPVAANVLLREVLTPLVSRYAAQISTWFFIRYSHPAPHLRLRFQLTGPFTGELLTALRAGIAGSDHEQLVRDYQSDTYRRELERYGEQFIEIAEKAFQASSTLLLSWLAYADPELQEKYLHLFALLTVDKLAGAFIPEAEACQHFFTVRAAAMRAEYADPAATKRLQDNRYRELTPELRDWLDGAAAAALPDPLLTAINDFGHQAMESARMTAALDAENRIALLADLIHMHVNRVFPAEQRQHEALLCHVLSKYNQYRVACRR